MWAHLQMSSFLLKRIIVKIRSILKLMEGDRKNRLKYVDNHTTTLNITTCVRTYIVTFQIDPELNMRFLSLDISKLPF